MTILGQWRHALGLLALAACGTGGVESAPQPAPARVQYAPFVASYAVISRGAVRQEPPGGQPGTSTFGQRYYLSVAVQAEGDGLRAELVVDSVPLVTGSDIDPLIAEATTAAAGARFTSPLASSGELTALEGDDRGNPLLRRIASRLEDFFLRLPEGGAAPGMTWSDTTSMETMSSGIELTVESVHRHQSVDWEAGIGARALRIRTESHYTVTGEGIQSGQAITIQGTGRRHAERVVDASGRYLTVTASDTTELTASVAAVGIDVPILQTRYDTLRILP